MVPHVLCNFSGHQKKNNQKGLYKFLQLGISSASHSSVQTSKELVSLAANSYCWNCLSTFFVNKKHWKIEKVKTAFLFKNKNVKRVFTSMVVVVVVVITD